MPRTFPAVVVVAFVSVPLVAEAAPGFGETYRQYPFTERMLLVHHAGDVCLGYDHKTCLCIEARREVREDPTLPFRSLGCWAAVSLPEAQVALARDRAGSYALLDLATGDREELSADRAAAQRRFVTRTGKEPRLEESREGVRRLAELPESKKRTAITEMASIATLGFVPWCILVFAVTAAALRGAQGPSKKRGFPIAMLLAPPTFALSMIAYYMWRAR